MPSGSCSVGGTCTIAELAGCGAVGAVGIAPVTSLARRPAQPRRMRRLRDRRPARRPACSARTNCSIAGRSASARSSTARGRRHGAARRGAVGGRLSGGAARLELSIAGIGGALPVSSRFIAILKVPSTITTTLAPTSSERIFEVMVERSVRRCATLALSLALLPWRPRPWPRAAGLVVGGCAAAACAARRAAAMKLDVLTGSFGRGGDFADRVFGGGDALRRRGHRAPLGRVPGSSG